MKRYIKPLALLTICAASASGISAQNTLGGYFLDGYTYRYQENPAIANDQNFVAMPGLGNINVAMNGNYGLSDVLFNVDGRTSLFLNPQVSASEFMSGLHNNNKLGVSTKIGVLAGGFKAWGGYNTVSINACAVANTNVPRDLYRFLKEGATNRSYSLSDLRVQAQAYAEVAFGHSRQITSEWRVGGTFKLLIGAANLDARLKNTTLTLAEDTWTIEAQGDMQSSVKGLTYETKYNDDTQRHYVSGLKVDNPGVNGIGAAIDLGSVYSPASLPDWQFSAAVLDLGFIHWNNNVVASTNGRQVVNTDDYHFSANDNADNSFKREWEDLRDQLSLIYQLNDNGDQGGRTTGIGATINLGVEYTLPVYRKLTFGALSSTRLLGHYTWSDLRLSANVSPAKCFDASVNVGMGSFGVGFGWMANVHVTGFNFFVGMDRVFRGAKQGVPLGGNGQFNLGMNFPF